MTKAEIKTGLQKGRRLIQEEWADPQEIRDVDQLVDEGIAVAGPWVYKDNYQCQMRSVIGKRDGPG